MQMGQFVPDENGPEPSLVSSVKKKRANKVGGEMSAEEIRMNKELLKEISKMKKQNQWSGSKRGNSRGTNFGA